jgi:hypothetical protein
MKILNYPPDTLTIQNNREATEYFENVATNNPDSSGTKWNFNLRILYFCTSSDYL